LNRSRLAGLTAERSNGPFFDFCVLQHLARMPQFLDHQRAQDYRLKNCRTSDSCFSLPTRFTLPFNCVSLAIQIFGTIVVWPQPETRYKQKEIFKMATAKKVAPKAAKVAKTVTAPAKAAKPVAKVAAKKAPVSKTAKAIAKLGEQIAKLTERKNKIGTEIAALRDQRTALKAAPAAVVVAPVAPKAKAAAPAKKAAAKK
jgi:cell division protein FtsB